MLGSIVSVVHGARRPRRLWITAAILHVLAGAVVAAAWGALLALVATVLAAPDARGVVMWSTLILALVFVPRLLGWTRFPPMLQSTWQVPQRWQATQSTLGRATSYGAMLGPGLLTRILVPTYYILLLWSVVTPSAWVVIAVWGLYGAVRGLPVLWLAVSAPVDAPIEAGLSWSVRLGAATTAMFRANAMMLLATAAVVGWRLSA